MSPVVIMNHPPSLEAGTSSASVPNLNAKSPHNKRRGMSETPEIQRKSRKLFARRDIDKLEEKARKRSLTNPRSSVDESESSRKSSVSSGRKRLFTSSLSSAASKESKQFAVTLLVSENDKTKIMDMLHKAKSVISKKVEKVMGKKPPKSVISSADALRTVLENWVDDAESKEKEDDLDEDEFIKAQEQQVEHLRRQGYYPPVHLPTTVVSPVPEEDDDFDDIEVQEVLEGQTSLLLPPKSKFKLEQSSLTPPVSPTRSLSPCEAVPRPAFLRSSAAQPDDYRLRRPSSHYDANAQAASSRPASRQDVITSPPHYVFDYSAFARSKTFQEVEEYTFDDDDDPEEDQKIQRPESMIIPIGGVWRPGDSDEEVDFFTSPAAAAVKPVDSNNTKPEVVEVVDSVVEVTNHSKLNPQKTKPQNVCCHDYK
jgi:hypothetical protein